VRVIVPQGRGRDVAQIAFDVGIHRVAFQQQILKKNEQEEIKDVIDVETATPTAKVFTDALMQTAFFDPILNSWAQRSRLLLHWVHAGKKR
jgi:hypothetical protein